MFSLTGSAFKVDLDVASGLENFYLISGGQPGVAHQAALERHRRRQPRRHLRQRQEMWLGRPPPQDS